MAKSEMNGTLKFIFSNIAIIGTVIGGLITIGYWLQATKSDITFLKACAANVDEGLMPELIEHDKRISLIEKDITYIKQSQDDTKNGIDNLNHKLDRMISRNDRQLKNNDIQ